MDRRSYPALCALALLAGCAANRDARPAGPAFLDRIMVVTTSAGQVSTLRFEPDGQVRARFDNRELVGTWAFAGEDLCFTWSGSFRECWPWSTDLRRGETRAITSDRGNQVEVRLQ